MRRGRAKDAAGGALRSGLGSRPGTAVERSWNADASVAATVTGVLVVFGLVMSFSASFVEAAAAGDAFGVFRRQLMWAVLGSVAFVVAAAVPVVWWRRVAWPALVVALAGLIAVLIPGVGMERFGASRWIGVGALSIQPSEIAKLAGLLWLADVYERARPTNGQLPDTDRLLVPALMLLGTTSLLVLVQPDLGTAVLLALIVGSILWVEGLRLSVAAMCAAGGVVLVGLAALVAPYRMLRITGWLSPESDPLGAGFQLLQARYALGSGGVLGVGLGSSRAKWEFVPNPETDFIFAIIGEELGIVGAFAVLLLFSSMLWMGVRIATRAPSAYGRTVAFAITAWLVGQALVNIGTVTGLLPITGVPLPLVSVGGSSLVVTLTALGILVSVAKDRPVRRQRASR